jgi:hypothetical protein
MFYVENYVGCTLAIGNVKQACTVKKFGSVVFLCRTPLFNPMTFLSESRFLILSRIIVLERTFRLVCFNYFGFCHEPFFTEHHMRDSI